MTMSGNGRKVRIFGPRSFESRWVVKQQGWLNHTFLCDAHVAVHDVWWQRGFQHAAVFDHDAHAHVEILDWLVAHAPTSHLIHPSGAALFMHEDTAASFALTWS
jgi:hypothetical protein